MTTGTQYLTDRHLDDHVAIMEPILYRGHEIGAVAAEPDCFNPAITVWGAWIWNPGAMMGYHPTCEAAVAKVNEVATYRRAHTVPASRIPDITAVNVWVTCLSCGRAVDGHAFWSIRKSAQLHTMHTCKGAKFLLGPTLIPNHPMAHLYA